MHLEIDEGYPTHRKTLRLCALLKCDTADAYPPRLWSWATRSAPDGVLTGMEPTEVELAVRYRGKPGTLFTALVAAGFVDCEADGAVSIHKWGERTGAAIARMETAAKASRERKRRWNDRQQERSERVPLAFPERSRTPTDKTSPGKSSPDLDLSDSAPLVVSPPDQARAETTPRAGYLPAWEWHRRFAIAWEGRYGTRPGGGEATAKASGKLSDQLAALTLAERMAAEGRMVEMFLEFLTDESPAVVSARHSWAFFVPRFDGYRVPKIVVVPKAPESFATRDAREAKERAERERKQSAVRVARTEDKLTTCAEHLYGKRDDRKCNRRCPRWEGD